MTFLIYIPGSSGHRLQVLVWHVLVCVRVFVVGGQAKVDEVDDVGLLGALLETIL
jgi:hypothetical protein